jgi:predicted GNAT family acetyltransferase
VADADLIVVNDAARGRYVATVLGAEVGYVEYDPVGTTSILIKHAEIAREHEGKGYGSRLVREALDDIRRQRLTVIPICPYTLNFIRRHREYVDLVRADMRPTI